MSEPLRRTPLYERHLRAGARMVPFAGFEMPLQYSSILEEHRAVRAHAGLFDVSHMGEVRVRGRGARLFAQRVFTNDVATAEPGRARYGLLCLENGGIVDDVTLYCLGPDELLFCVNASNTSGDLAWLREAHRALAPDCELLDESAATALLALQGPAAPRILRSLLPASARAPGRWRCLASELAGVPVLVAGTGYTGEPGYELYCPADGAARVWDAVCAAGGGELALAGLGARDTLRTEMAYPLYGHELDRNTNPLEAGLERFLAFDRGFIGEPALAAIRKQGPARRRVGLWIEGRALARPGYPIGHEAAGPLGEVTSGTFGPSVERSIAIGYVPARYAEPGTKLYVVVRDQRVTCTVAKTPFLNRKT
jgi:aminomethyltransferase